ncbi:MAG TPA: DUF4982 domain-containing protein [Vicinamibacterales bacterium]|jgi:hypothetical protein
MSLRVAIAALLVTGAVAVTARPAGPAPAAAGHRIERTITRGWTFNYFAGENGDETGCESPAFDDSTWPEVAVPHTWQTYETTGKIHPFIHDATEGDDPYWWRGWGWYRKHFSIDAGQSGRKIFVEFDGVQKYSRVFVNGRFAGDHKGGYNGFELDVTSLVRLGGDNVLAVAVNRNLEPESAQQTGHETWQHDMNAREIVARNKGRSPGDRANINTWLYEDHGCDREYANAPLKHVNPKGFVDAWRSQYVGRTKEIVVDSNAETVELKVNGRSVGTRSPRFEDAYVVRFQDVPIERGVLTAEARRGGETITSNLVMAGPPARLALTARPTTLEAGLDSVVIVRADIVDADGHHVNGATQALRWAVTGPATLVGPPEYTTDTTKNGELSGTMYIDAPAFNVIRSSGKPGRITVRVQSPGLTSAAVEILAAPPPPVAGASVVEPPVPAGSRRPVAREGAPPAAIAAVLRHVLLERYAQAMIERGEAATDEIASGRPIVVPANTR